MAMSHWNTPEHTAVQPVAPPVGLRVFPARIWPPAKLRWAAGLAMWKKALGAKLDPVPGELIELVTTQSGDVLGCVKFQIEVDHSARTEVMLLPLSDLYEPATEADRARLLALLAPYDLGWTSRR